MDIYEIAIYGITVAFIAFVIFRYLDQAKKMSLATQTKVDLAKASGRFEPLSLYPYIDPKICIGSGACVSACPEKDVLGIMNGTGTLINTTSCIGHGACFQACPVDAISLRIGTEKRGVELPHVKPNYETNVDGIFIAGELGGMGLIKNSIEQGIQAVVASKKRIDLSKNIVEGSLDLVIIGAGPAGIGAALKAKELGLHYLVLEQESLGGTVFTYPRAKIVMTHPVDLPLHGPVKLINTNKQELLAMWELLREQYQLNIKENTKVNSINKRGDGFVLEINGGSPIEARAVILAIGRRGTPRKLNVPGELSTKVAYRLLDAEAITGERILVVGGGDSAVESALLLMDQNEVFLSYRKNAFARIKALNEEQIQRSIAENRVSVMFESEVLEISDDNVRLIQNGSELSLPKIDRIYIFAGGELPTDFLKNAGIEMELAVNKIVKAH
jgi:thioredoxin reductase